MTLIQWLDHRMARRREARLGPAPMTAAEYRQRSFSLRRLQALEDPDCLPDQLRRFKFQLEGETWIITGTRAELGQQLERAIAAYEAWRKRRYALTRQESARTLRRRQRIERRYERIQRRRIRVRAWGRTITDVSIFLLKCLLVLLVLAIVLCLLVLPPVLIVVPSMLDDIFRRR